MLRTACYIAALQGALECCVLKTAKIVVKGYEVQMYKLRQRFEAILT